jgi:chorismate mutase
MDEVVLQQLSKRFELLSQIEELKNTSGLQARMPYKVIYR